MGEEVAEAELDHGADYSWAIACLSFGEWRFHDCPGAPWQQETRLHNAEIRHHPRCGGYCSATRNLEVVRAQGRLVGKPRHRIRAAIG